jgi:hypothetical protein
MIRAGLCAALFLVGCAPPDPAHPAIECDEAMRCPVGLTCHRGFCVRDDSACTGVSPTPCWPGGPGCEPDVAGGHVCRGVCRHGVTRCAPGADVQCTGAILPRPGDDGCTAAGSVALDDDCDGRIDEDCACVEGATQPCFGGPPGAAGVSSCVAGMQTCREQRFGECVAHVLPGVERCLNDGVDDDCNGVIDDVPGLGAACTVPGASGACAAGTYQCMGGSLPECAGAAPTRETCNGVDDDCDGTVDEDEGATVTCVVCEPACAAGQLCADGVCCDVGRSNCSGACRDLLRDKNHCGGCGRRCEDHQRCVGGACCADGSDVCDGACTDLETSTTHCGACGHRCGTGERCMDGVCCPAGRILCMGECVDPETDRRHCGGCREECASRDTCESGACVCDSSGSGGCDD